jgi:hypothetical protein
VKVVARVQVPVEERHIQIPALDLAVVQPHEAGVVDVVGHLLDVQEVLRSRVVAARHPEHADVVALDEAERRLEVRLDLAEDDLRVEPVVRIVGGHAVGPVTSRHAFVHAPDAECVDHGVVLASQEP